MGRLPETDMRRLAMTLEDLVPGERCWMYAAAGAEVMNRAAMSGTDRPTRFDVVAGWCGVLSSAGPSAAEQAASTSVERERFHAWIVDVPGGGITDLAPRIVFEAVTREGGLSFPLDVYPWFVRRDDPDRGHMDDLIHLDDMLHYLQLPSVTSEVRAMLATRQSSDAVRRIAARAWDRLRG